MEAFAAFTQASEQLQERYQSLQGQLGRIQNELETVLETVPFAIWVLGAEGEGFKVAMKILDRGRLHIAALCVAAKWVRESRGGKRVGQSPIRMGFHSTTKRPHKKQNKTDS